ncbi:MAG: hypothetical protein Q9187_000822 [Circinaria calcarea]
MEHVNKIREHLDAKHEKLGSHLEITPLFRLHVQETVMEEKVSSGKIIVELPEWRDDGD